MVSGLARDLAGFGFGVYLTLPFPGNIGYAFIDFLASTNSASNGFIAMSPIYKVCMSLGGLFIIMYVLSRIGPQVHEGDFI